MATDELRLNNLGACHWLCPACGSDDWKSAKLVILENTTNIEGGGRGNVRDPGMFSGSGREFFLSERWFSWDNPIDLRLELTATTKLVEEVKNFMLSYSDRLGSPKPQPHVRPDKRKFFRGYEEPAPLARRRILKSVTIPELPKRRTFIQRLSQLIFNIIGSAFFAVLAVAISSFFLDYTMNEAIIMVGMFFVIILLHIRGYQKAEQAPQDLPQQMTRKEKEYREEREAYRRSRARYLRRSEEYEAEVRRYEAESSAHAGRVMHMESLRDLVWKSARVCMRCGKCYLGERTD